jgi:hypothetical protein
MTTPYLAQQSINDFGSRPSDLQFSAALAASTDTALIIPGDAPRYKALIHAENKTWVALNATAAAPAAVTFAKTTSELMTAGSTICREVKAGDVLHFFSATATTAIGVSLFALGTFN